MNRAGNEDEDEGEGEEEKMKYHKYHVVKKNTKEKKRAST